MPQGQVYRDFIPVGTSRYGPREVGFSIASIEIDNPTGQWLLLRESQIRIPPYTLNWRLNIQPSTRTLDISAQSPVGFNATATGSVVRVVARDYEITPSQGVAMTPSQPTTLREANFDQATSGGNGGTLVSVAANQRCRLYAARFSYNENEIMLGAVLIPCLCQLSVSAPSGGQFWHLLISPEKPTDETVFGPGLDLDLGQDVTYDMLSGTVAGLTCDITVIYALL